MESMSFYGAGWMETPLQDKEELVWCKEQAKMQMAFKSHLEPVIDFAVHFK